MLEKIEKILNLAQSIGFKDCRNPISHYTHDMRYNDNILYIFYSKYNVDKNPIEYIFNVAIIKNNENINHMYDIKQCHTENIVNYMIYDDFEKLFMERFKKEFRKLKIEKILELK